MSINNFVISGMSGRFPMSRNVDELAKNLYNGIDMVTDSEDRWPNEIFGFTNRMGRMPDFNRFDEKYFGEIGNVVDIIDPKSKILLETTYEAIIDSGINPQTLRGSRTGVYIGISDHPVSDKYLQIFRPESTKSIKNETNALFANSNALIANRISYVFDFKGPSLVTDTACSASLSAFNIAMNDLKLGHIDYAIVGASNLTLQPVILDIQQKAGFCSPRGISAVLDESADGYVKADATACLILQRKTTAKRIYATVLSSRINIDGKKTAGMYFPSSEAQENLMVMAYEEAGIDPLKITYVEGHLTGTKAGDPQEVRAIYNAYVKRTGRTDPLPLGCLKSNMGHAESCSGIAAIIKVLISFENQRLPPNINLNEIRSDCKVYCPPLYPNTQALEYEPGIAGINNFGVGGVNGNILIEPNYKQSDDEKLKIAETIPRIVNICGRTEEAVRHVFDFIENNPKKVSRDFLALLTDTMKSVPTINSAGFPFKGSMIIKKIGEDSDGIRYQFTKQLAELKSKSIRPIWFLFPGLGGQWPAMAKALMPIKVFADKVEECHQILSEFEINLRHLLLSEDKKAISTMTDKFCATTAIQLALFEILKLLDITPDGIIGHSFGEIACAYADGCLTTEQALVITYMRGFITENDELIPKGFMVVCGLSEAEAKKLIPPEVVIACINAAKTTVISGPEKQMKQLMNELKQKQIFCHQLESSDIPYHSKYLKTSAEPMIEAIKKYVPYPKKRSSKWISTSVINSNSDEVLKYASAEYFVNNLVSQVQFFEKFAQLPSDAIVLEIGPDGLFKRIVKDILEYVTYVSLLKKDSNETNLEHFLSSIAMLFEQGFNPSIEKLYPQIEWPVSRSTPSIGSLMKWDHSTDHYVGKYPDHYNFINAGDLDVSINLNDSEDKFYGGHCIDCNVILPATAYLMLVWQHFSASLGKEWKDVPVIFENVQFIRTVHLSDNLTKLKVRYDQQTSDFHVLENGDICAFGKIRTSIDNILLQQHKIEEQFNTIQKNCFILQTDDIYKELRFKGYEYSGDFKGLKEICTNNFKIITGKCEWSGKFVPFLDALLQPIAFAEPNRSLLVPVMIRSIRIDPKVLFGNIKQNRIIEDLFVDEFIFGEQNDQGNPTDLAKIREENFCLFRSELQFYFNYELKYTLTYGLEIEGVTMIGISRKTDSMNLVLDSYEFLPNDDNNAIDEYERKQILEYIEICKSIAVKIKQNGFNGIKCDFNYQNFSTDLSDDYRKQNNNKYVIFKILDNIYKSITLESHEEFQISQSLISPTARLLAEDLINNISQNERLIRSMVDIVSENLVPERKIKVTEINLTPNLLAKEVKEIMSYFQIYPIEIDYNLVVEDCKQINSELNCETKVCDLNEQLVIQSSDLIILRDSPGIDLEKTVQSLSNKIIGNGFLLVICKIFSTEPELILNSLINGENLMDNINLEERYQNILMVTKIQFQLICKKVDPFGNCVILFRKSGNNKKIPENNQIIEINGQINEHWFRLLKEKLLFAQDFDNNTDNIWLIAKDSNINGIIGLINCLRLEPGGEYLRCIFDFDNYIKLPVDWNSKYLFDILNKDLVINVIKGGHLGIFRYLKLSNEADKVVSNEYYLNLEQTKDVPSLKWCDLSTFKEKKVTFDMNRNINIQIPVSIYSSGLTSHDVLIVSRQIPNVTQKLSTDSPIGCEFAGRRNDTGQRVMGFDVNRCLATSINANENSISLIPEHWSMDDAITILETYLTAWYGLIERARLRKGESILINSGSGCVDLSAINICKHYNCDIYVTVENEEKKQFLIDEYNIPENRIFSSRDIQFKFNIKELTKGTGVKIVFNCLTLMKNFEKFSASLECLTDSGTFIELGKFDMFQNRKQRTFDFSRDISFIRVDILNSLMNDPDLTVRFFDWLHKNCRNGCVKPLNRILFNVTEVEKAFRHIKTGKHIGKVIIKIREEEVNRNPILRIKSAQEQICLRKAHFDPNKVYIITGGLGGFGLELIHWMIFKRAAKFVLTSRSGIKTSYQNYVINRLVNFGKANNDFNIDIKIAKNNCLTVESAQQVLSEASQLGQIGGVFHSALVLNDSLLRDLIYEKFCETIDSKYKVCSNLDALTRQLDYKLDYFVVFSSIMSGKGSDGQSNYSFGNSICERICEQRRNDGLHGLAIQFGRINDIGYFEDIDSSVKKLNFEKQTLNSCFAVLDKFLSIDNPIVTSYVKIDQIDLDQNKRQGMFGEYWKALGIDPETIDNNLTLGEIGIESMISTELHQDLQRDTNIKINTDIIKLITVNILKQYTSGNFNDITDYMLSIMRARDILPNYQFILTKDKFTLLNDIKVGKPIYFMPPLEITYSGLYGLAKKFDRPVIGINWTQDMNKFETIEEITAYYEEILNDLEPNSQYDLVGFLDGAMVILNLLAKGLITKAVIIDVLSNKLLEDSHLYEDKLVEYLFGFFSNNLPKSLSDNLLKRINLEPDLNSKLDRIVSEIRNLVGRRLIATDLETIFRITVKRLKIIVNYLHQNRNKCTNQLKAMVHKVLAQNSGTLKLIKPIKFDDSIDLSEIESFTRDLYCIPGEQELKEGFSIEILDSRNPFEMNDLLADKIFMEFE